MCEERQWIWTKVEGALALLTALQMPWEIKEGKL